ncbi:MAG TPA: tripartite tricarboxylate transporter TctB family protein [Xanthobacteraceae bacterium]|nr:tripartite tricarboxylate transporter TctB family protein [Xanthobacteraceae bacterium]
MIGRELPLRDYCAGLFVIFVGAYAVWEASGYPFGSLAAIGSGFFPVMLGVLALPIGAAILWEAATRPASAGQADDEKVELRPILAVTGALLAFTLVIDRAGLAPAIFAAAVLASLAEREFRPVSVAVLAAGLAAICAAIFVYALKLPIQIFAW